MARLAYDVNVVNICFGNTDVFKENDKHNNKHNKRNAKNQTNEIAELPSELTIEIPRDFNERFKARPDNDYIDALESFVYNHLTKRFRRECTFCQIWIGDDLDVALKRIEESRAKEEEEQ